jgi:hypothetical protein
MCSASHLQSMQVHPCLVSGRSTFDACSCAEAGAKNYVLAEPYLLVATR